MHVHQHTAATPAATHFPRRLDWFHSLRSLFQVRCWVSALVNPPWLCSKRLKTNTLLKSKSPQRVRKPAFPISHTHVHTAAAKTGGYSWPAACHRDWCVWCVHRRKVKKSHMHSSCKGDLAKTKTGSGKTLNLFFSKCVPMPVFCHDAKQGVVR